MLSPAVKKGEIRFIDDLEGGRLAMSDDRSTNSFVAGCLPNDRLYQVLKNAKHLKMSRVQLLAVMSLSGKKPPRKDNSLDDDEEEFVFGQDEIFYRDFANSAAELITKFYDPREQRRRSMLEKRTDNNALNVMGGLTKQELAKRLQQEFKKVDTKVSERTAEARSERRNRGAKRRAILSLRTRR